MRLFLFGTKISLSLFCTLQAEKSSEFILKITDMFSFGDETLLALLDVQFTHPQSLIEQHNLLCTNLMLYFRINTAAGAVGVGLS